MVDKKGRKIGTFRRTTYTIIGLSGVGSLLWALFNWSLFVNMPLWSIIMFVLLVIGGINWLFVAISGYNNYDLLKLLGAK